MLFLLLEVLTKHFELLDLLVKVKFVIRHDVIKLSLCLLVTTQLVLQPLKNLFLGLLLLHSIIILRLIFIGIF